MHHAISHRAYSNISEKRDYKSVTELIVRLKKKMKIILHHQLLHVITLTIKKLTNIIYTRI